MKRNYRRRYGSVKRKFRFETPVTTSIATLVRHLAPSFKGILRDHGYEVKGEDPKEYLHSPSDAYKK